MTCYCLPDIATLSLMNEHRKKLWVEALRSGDYAQGTGSLRPTSDSFCCLGVLCDISGVGMWTEGDEYHVSGETAKGFPPGAVIEWLDVSHHDLFSGIEFTIGDRKDNLAYLNDSGATFAEIADAIEAQLLTLQVWTKVGPTLEAREFWYSDTACFTVPTSEQLNTWRGVS